MAGSGRTILLTGAAGVIGQAVAAELSGSRVIGLVHHNTEAPGVDEVLPADLSQPRFGLSEERWGGLAEEVDSIVHSGALTKWGQPPEPYQAINVGGTREVIELARLAQAPVHLLSTIFVLALDGHDGLRPDNLVRNYIASKLDSERLLAESGVPHSIFRPTNLVGDSRTGASSEPQIVQALSDFVCRGRAPYFPMHPGNLVDVAPLEAVSIPVARAAERDDVGHVFHIAYGEEAMNVETALDVITEHAHSIGRDIERAPVVDPSGPLPIPLEEIPATSRAFMRVGIDVSEVTHASGGVLPSSLHELRERYDIPVTTDVDAFKRSLNYWAEERGQRRAMEEAT